MELPISGVSLEIKPAAYVDLPPTIEEVNTQIAELHAKIDALCKANELLQAQVLHLQQLVVQRMADPMEEWLRRKNEEKAKEEKQRQAQLGNTIWLSNGTATALPVGTMVWNGQSMNIVGGGGGGAYDAR